MTHAEIMTDASRRTRVSVGVSDIIFGQGDLDVTHADIMTEASGRSKGCAIVEYGNPSVRSSSSLDVTVKSLG